MKIDGACVACDAGNGMCLCGGDAFFESGMCVSCAERHGDGCWTCDVPGRCVV